MKLPYLSPRNPKNSDRKSSFMSPKYASKEPTTDHLQILQSPINDQKLRDSQFKKR